jgi:hypothetical protein
MKKYIWLLIGLTGVGLGGYGFWITYNILETGKNISVKFVLFASLIFLFGVFFVSIFLGLNKIKNENK